MDIMCRGAVDKRAFLDANGQSFDAYFSRERAELANHAADGLITNTSSGLRVTETGSLMLRTIAMVFDHYRRTKNAGATFFANSLNR